MTLGDMIEKNDLVEYEKSQEALDHDEAFDATTEKRQETEIL